MAIEGWGDVSACGHENIGIRDMGFRDDVTGTSESEEEVEAFSEGEDTMVGLSGADVFFDGIYGPEGQQDVDVVRNEEEFDNYEFCIDETLDIQDGEGYRLYELQEPAGAESDEIVSCVRALVQSLPLPGQISPQELIPVNPQLFASNHSFDETKCDAINQPSLVLKHKHEIIDVKPEERGCSFKKQTNVVSCASMPSRYQEFEDFLIMANEYSAGHSGCESSLVSPFKDINDSYWPDMVIQAESPVKLPSADTATATRGSKVFNSQSTRSIADDPNKRLRMKTLNYNHVPVAATTDKYSPAELILTFDHVEAIPSESKLNNVFRRFGTLREAETLIYREASCARVVFKKSSEAEVAVSSSKAFSIMGPSVVKYELGYAPMTAMPAVMVENATPAMQSAESVVINAREYESEMINDRENEPEDMHAQQMQYEHLEETYKVDVALESEAYEGSDDVDIMD